MRFFTKVLADNFFEHERLPEIALFRLRRSKKETSKNY